MAVDWKLEKYFYSSIKDKKIGKDLQEYDAKVKKFLENYKDKVSLLPDEGFLVFLEAIEVLGVEAEKIIVFLGLTSSLDTQNQEVQREVARIEKLMSDYSEKFLFIDEEYKKIGHKKLIELANLKMMEPFKNYIIETASELKYSLTEPQELVFLKLTNATESNMCEELTNSFQFNYKGQKISEDEVRMLRESSDRTTRKKAFKMLADIYNEKQNQIVLGNLYSLVCKYSVANLELRGLTSVMSERNISEQLSDAAVNNLLTKVSDKYNLYHTFLEKKSKIIGLKKFEIHDIFAPYPSSIKEQKMPFEKGWSLYRETIKKVDPVLASFSDEMFKNGRISASPKPGKQSGAYAQYTKNLPEFILLNWANTPSDVSTLAHEMGHAFRGKLSKKQKSLVYDTPLTLAETASIFNETLMFETLLDITKNKEAKKKLICGRLDDIFGTIFRQVAYVNFEKRCHESFKKNEPLTFDDYNKIWLEEMHKLYGNKVVIEDDLIKSAWSSISHIYQTPFYCYTYAFGNIISLNLYQNFKQTKNKKEFIAKYHKFLAAGGSDTPENLLKDIFGIIINDNFYELAFMHIEELLKKID